MALRRLFNDQASDLRKRLVDALDHMSSWTETSAYFNDPAFKCRKCTEAYDDNIEELVWINNKWQMCDTDGHLWSLDTVSIDKLAILVDWIELNYSPDHSCGHRNV